MRLITSLLAAALALAGCKEDKPKAEAEKTKLDTATDKAKEVLETAKDRASEMGKRAGEAVENAKDRATDTVDPEALKKALVALDEKISKGLTDIQNASTDDARKAAVAAIEKLKQEKEEIEAKLRK